MNADPGQARSWLSDKIAYRSAAVAFVYSAAGLFA